jgi:hypothetical protein
MAIGVAVGVGRGNDILLEKISSISGVITAGGGLSCDFESSHLSFSRRPSGGLVPIIFIQFYKNISGVII